MIDISSDIVNIMQDFNNELQDTINKAGATAAKETKKVIKKKAPKRTGDYARSFRVTKENQLGNVKHIVHSPKNYRMIHLLEHGHAMPNGGRAKAQPHMKQAEEIGIKTFEEEIRKGIK